jgi:23S rRNA (cytidine1920-2'-O)/16S rRNA (cytidine1409-2'-O)-methyltransferase
VLTKPRELLDEDCDLVVEGSDHPWVSRGGIKLDHALDHFGLDVTGAVALDIGASTGGFTDVLLTRGAAKVHAVDVGTDQLAPNLRADPRVVVHEQVNARDLTEATVPDPIDIVVCDASFISLAKVLEAPLKLAKPGAQLVALVKPQFEAGRADVGKGGVVKDPKVHARVCAEAKDWVESQGWRVLGIVESPITGPDGNREYLLGAVRNG